MMVLFLLKLLVKKPSTELSLWLRWIGADSGGKVVFGFNDINICNSYVNAIIK